ncbi:alpha/beta fold hydrolase [Actinomycetospora sp. CA-101289]|uniref:alpha/beta fold hydrolase n=1 Tax=Actinomycetospora sp. CA-101289 TaxID=3239893 RepID=UPI003D988616
MGVRDEPGQTLRFARSDERTVAWAAVGTGPPLVVGGWWMGHLELNWADPAFRAFFGRLAAGHTVVRYDRPGSGLSPGAPDHSLDGEVAALADVVAALGEAPVTLLGASSGGPVAAALAARRPDLVERLVLYGTFADGSRLASPAVRDQLVALVGTHWGLGSRVLADLFLPGATPAERDGFARFQRASATAATASAALAAAYAFDVRAELDRVAAPTLVLHRRDDRAVPVALGRDVAATVPDASFVALEGDEHFPWRGDADAVRRAVLAFLPGSSPAPRREVTPPTSVLSPRELDVLRLVAEGLADREIARRLSLSPHTVHRHLANVRSKLDLPSRAAAAAYAERHHLLEP